MRFLVPTKKTKYRSVGAALLAAILAASQPAGAVEPTEAALQAWQTQIAQVPQPAQGCFTTSYPSLVWRKVACTSVQAPPAIPKPSGPRPRAFPFTVGGSNGDLSAVAPSGKIFHATGSFDSVTNVTSEASPPPQGGTPVANNYSLQLNTNYFATPACMPSPNPNCRGWQQFIYWNDGSQGAMIIQYWLMDYNTTCPTGWKFSQTPVGNHCFRNNSGAFAGITNQPITNLKDFRVSGSANAAGDSMTLVIGNYAKAMSGDNYLTAANGWTVAEFNVFGGPGGQRAVFNPGASIQVRTQIHYGGDAPPGCTTESFTGETNNLSFGAPKPPATPPGPSIQFIENTANNSPPNCAFAAVIGDTHQRTVAGLLYDFQASGDFVEAQVGPDFEVQTRKISGAPNWPDTSVNQSVATRMGGTKVVLCEGSKLLVDGQLANLLDGQTHWVPTGIDIARSGNTYYIVDQAGNSVTATVNPGYLDVGVGLGSYPVTVRGLLGNPRGDITKLEARDGTQFSVPVSFSDLYHRYGDSWRLDPAHSLLTECGDKAEQGNPSGPFTTRDLDPRVRDRTQGVCARANVIPQWLQACTLDVAVLGDNAAAKYAGLEAPALINP